MRFRWASRLKKPENVDENRDFRKRFQKWIFLKNASFWCGKVKTEAFENGDEKINRCDCSHGGEIPGPPCFIVFGRFSVKKKNTAKTLMWAEIFCFVFACMKTFENVVVSSRSLFKMQHWSISAHTTYDKFELGHNIALPLPAPPSLSLKGTDSSDVSVFEKRNWKNVFRSH